MSLPNYQPIKHLLTQLKSQPCQRKNCLSQNKGTLEIVWFGKQYQTKDMTCTCCYLLDDEAIRKSLPASYNVLPLLKFNQKLLEEYKLYEQKKQMATWHTTVVKTKKVEFMAEVNAFEARLVGSLKGLVEALSGFVKKLQVKNREIYNNETMNEIIQMKGKNSFQTLLNKINQLVKQLNYSQVTKNYQFQRIQTRNKKLQKQKQKIIQVTQKVDAVLKSLWQTIQKKNQTIAKI